MVLKVEGSLEAEGKTTGLHTPFIGQHWRQARRVGPREPDTPPHFQSRDTVNLCSSSSPDSEPTDSSHMEVGACKGPSQGLAEFCSSLPQTCLTAPPLRAWLLLALCHQCPICLGWVWSPGSMAQHGLPLSPNPGKKVG